MNIVQPIRDVELLRDIEDYLQEKNQRDFIMFILGIYTGLRISDVLALRTRDLKDKEYLVIEEKKTKKKNRIKINPYLKRHLKVYLSDKEPMEYVIKSRNGENKPITRERAYAILRQAAEKFGLDAIGTHTLRKSFGYHNYKRTKDIAMLQEIFNHSKPEVTLRYIGIIQDTKDKFYDNVRY